MYNTEKKFENIGPAFEDLSDNELYNTDGAATPIMVLSIAGKAAVSALISGAISCSLIVTFD